MGSMVTPEAQGLVPDIHTVPVLTELNMFMGNTHIRRYPTWSVETEHTVRVLVWREHCSILPVQRKAGDGVGPEQPGLVLSSREEERARRQNSLKQRGNERGLGILSRGEALLTEALQKASRAPLIGCTDQKVGSLNLTMLQ